MKRISYDRGDYGYQISIYPPSENYPMYQVSCNLTIESAKTLAPALGVKWYELFPDK